MVNILIAPFLSAKIKKIVESAIKAKNGKLCVQTGKSINSCLLFFQVLHCTWKIHLALRIKWKEATTMKELSNIRLKNLFSVGDGSEKCKVEQWFLLILEFNDCNCCLKSVISRKNKIDLKRDFAYKFGICSKYVYLLDALAIAWLQIITFWKQFLFERKTCDKIAM